MPITPKEVVSDIVELTVALVRAAVAVPFVVVQIVYEKTLEPYLVSIIESYEEEE